MSRLPTGVRLALDWGRARIGVAACDRDGMLAYPVTTVDARRDPLAELVRLVDEYEPVAVIVGLPLALDGQARLAADQVTAQAELFARAVDVPVWMVDERLTTVTASRGLSEAGRSTRRQRAVIDQAAAVAILEGVLAAERRGVEVGWPLDWRPGE